MTCLSVVVVVVVAAVMVVMAGAQKHHDTAASTTLSPVTLRNTSRVSTPLALDQQTRLGVFCPLVSS